MDALTNPGRQFLGCLLWLPCDTARRVLAGMRATDLADPQAAEALQLVIELVADGHAPTPVAVFAHAVDTGRAPGEHRRSRLALWLADTYHAVASPLQAEHLKTVVLQAAWRRAVAEYARRLLQAAEDSPTDVLAELADDTDTAGDLWRRYRASLGEPPATAGFREVA